MSDVSDNFSRADENPLSNGGKWIKPAWAGSPNMIVSLGAASSNTENDWGMALWTGNKFSNDQFSQVVVNYSGNYAWLGIFICMDPVVQTGYGTFIHSAVGNLNYIYRYDAGVTTTLSGLIPYACNGLTVRLGISGTTITLAVGGSSMTCTDSSPITSGYPGLGRNSVTVGANGGMLFTGWSGGPIVTRPDFSPFPFPRLD